MRKDKIQFDTPLFLEKRTEKYIVTTYHRNRNPHKSQWSIKPQSEIACFCLACDKNWKTTHKGWGLLLQGNVPVILGITKTKLQSKIAFFIDGNGNNIWHGYPSNYSLNIKERPKDTVLKKWYRDKLISKSERKRILKGEKCHLLE